MKRLALHVCCGICAIPALALLKKREVAVTGIFFNPNIDSRREYTRRQDIASRYFKEQGLDFYGFPYEPRDFLDALGGCAQKPQRCRACWDLRIAKTASFADAGGFDLFSTTLLSSPYQDVSIIREVAETRSGKSIFFREDFRSGFTQGYHEAKSRGWYIQNYCGCLYSQEERNAKKKKTATAS
jgi:hypothetical protein